MYALGEIIRTLRRKNGLTQSLLAEKTGVQFQTVSKWETSVSVPDTILLPAIADALCVSIDELFGRSRNGCADSVSEDERDFLLKAYARMYAPEAGPWNLSVENRYLEYKFAAFFEEHFSISEGAELCNIGIGAGEWDHYLSYKLKNGTLTGIDRLENCCRQLEQRLRCEGNPNSVKVLCADARALNLSEAFDIVTLVGTTAIESGDGLALLEQAFRFVKRGGAVYYQSMDKDEDCNAVLQTAFRHGMSLDAFEEDHSYGFRCRYYKFLK